MTENPDTTAPGTGEAPAPGTGTVPAPVAPPAEDLVTKDKRYIGQVQANQQLALQKRDLEAKLATQASELERLSTQLAIKDTEKAVAVGETTKSLEKALQEKAETDRQLAVSGAKLLKIEIAKEINHPELLMILDTIPDLTDKAVLTVVMNDLVRFREQGIKEREEVLLRGVTPGISPAQPKAEPASKADWMARVNQFLPGTKERQQAFDAYGDWQIKNPKGA